MRLSKINKNSSIIIKMIIITLVFSLININIEQTVLADINTDEEATNFVENIFAIKSKAILSKDLDSIEALYATDTRYGRWAYEYEQRKVKYINNWAEKQGIKFIDIIPKVVIRKSNIKKDKCFFNILCSTEYKYVYTDQPEQINSSRIGTYHSIRLTKRDGGWIITTEWYTDPFADSLSLESIKMDEIKEHIKSQPSRDISTIDERRKGVIEYAEKYCGAATIEEYGFKYNKEYRDFNPEGGDCANFASQILHEGGKFKENSAWNYDRGSGTGSWVNAGKFTYYMLNSGRASVIAKGSYEKVYKASYKLLPGDFVAYEKKGDIMHVSVVTGVDSKGYSLVTCHNTDRNNVPWDLGWSDKKMNFWLIRVHY
ncbi:MAG TPA: amidase domain-containing protein [Clostridium sp.]